MSQVSVTSVEKRNVLQNIIVSIGHATGPWNMQEQLFAQVVLNIKKIINIPKC